jgi:WD40 repeat protein
MTRRSLSTILVFCLTLLHSAFAQEARLFVQQGPNYPTSLAISASGDFLASGDSDAVRVYDLATKRQIRTLRHHLVKGVAFSPDGALVASAGQDESEGNTSGNLHYSVRLWNVANGSLVHGFSQVNDGGYSSAIQAVVFNPLGGAVAAACDDQTIRIWSLSPPYNERRIKTSHPLHSLAISPNGKLIAGGGFSGYVGLWSVADAGITLLHDLSRGSQAIYAVSFNPSDNELAVAGESGEIDIWDVTAGKIQFSLKAGKSIRSLAFDQDGHVLASASGAKVTLWSLETKQALTDLASPFFQNVNSLLYGRGHTLFGALDSNSEGIVGWDTSTGKRDVVFRRAAAPIFCLHLLRQENVSVLVSESSGESNLWDYETGELRATVEQHFFCGLPGLSVTSPDASLFAVWQMSTVQVYSGRDKSLISSFTAHGMTATAVFSADSKRVASGSMDGFVDIWDLQTKTRIAEINCNPPPKTLEGPVPGVQDPATLFPSIVSTLAFSADGTILAAYADNGSQGSKIRFWEVASGKQIPWMADAGDFVRSLSFDGSGRLLAAGSGKGDIQIWSMQTRTMAARLSGHTADVTGLVFDNERQLLISAALDGEVKIWDIKKQDQILTAVSTGNADWLVVRGEGWFDGTADAMQSVGWRIGDTNEIAPLASFYSDYFYPGLYINALKNQVPTPNTDIATALQLPGLKTMLQQGLASIIDTGDRRVLCFSTPPTASPVIFEDAQPFAFDVTKLINVSSDKSCPYQYELSKGRQYELISQRPSSPPATNKADGHQKSSVAGATLHVQTIAVGDYSVADSGFAPLPLVVGQAERLKQYFEEAKQKNVTPFKEIHIWDGLYDRAATREAIRSRIADISEHAGEDDVLLLFISGHGIVPLGQEMFYFIAADTKGPDPRTETQTGLSTAMLADALRTAKFKRMLLVVDACQSGGALDALAKIVQLKTEQPMRVERQQSGNSEHPTGVGVYMIAAASPLQIAQSTASEDSLSGRILNAFQPSGGNTTVWVSDVLRSIETVPSESPQQSTDKPTPMILSVGVDFPIAGRAP